VEDILYVNFKDLKSSWQKQKTSMLESSVVSTTRVNHHSSASYDKKKCSLIAHTWDNWSA